MELIVISDTRLKIMLTAQDMTEYNIDAMTLDTECAKTKRILYDILDRAKKKAGFAGDSDKVFVQIFPSKDGGCELYVTKYSNLYDTDEADGAAINRTQKSQGGIKKRLVYRFGSVRDLLRACRALKKRGYKEASDAYISDKEKIIYLVLYDGAGSVDTSVVLEYADPVFFGGVSLYISEHSTPICEDSAVSLLAELC